MKTRLFKPVNKMKTRLFKPVNKMKTRLFKPVNKMKIVITLGSQNHQTDAKLDIVVR